MKIRMAMAVRGVGLLCVQCATGQCDRVTFCEARNMKLQSTCLLDTPAKPINISPVFK